MKIREVFSKSPEVNEWRYFRSRTDQKNFLTGIYPLIIGATAVMLLDIKLNANLANVATFGFCVFGSSALLWRSEFELVFKWISRFNRRYKFPSALFALFGSFFLINALSQRADAQFFQGAQNWMTSQFSGAGEAIPLVFNVLRGLFLLYLGISLVKVIQAARQDEDWQNLARTPMIILIAMTMGDILANLIVGGTGG
jgi:hypothetical protein